MAASSRTLRRPALWTTGGASSSRGRGGSRRRGGGKVRHPRSGRQIGTATGAALGRRRRRSVSA